jgi:hypothetical protein
MAYSNDFIYWVKNWKNLLDKKVLDFGKNILKNLVFVKKWKKSF